MLQALAGTGAFGLLAATFILGMMYGRHHRTFPLHVTLTLEPPERPLRCVLSHEEAPGGMKTAESDQDKRTEA